MHDALRWARRRLATSRSASLDADLLLSYAIQRPRAWLLAHGDATLEGGVQADFESLVLRRAAGVPVAYLRGFIDWYDIKLEVRPGVLIPRPETEMLLDEAARLIRNRSLRFVADVGTGTGALAIGLARACPGIQVVAIDVSQMAIELARANIKRYDLQNRIRVVRGSLLESLEKPPDLIVANLPYLSADMMASLDSDVRHEPEIALYGGETGIELYVAMLQQIADRDWRIPCVLEIDPRQTSLFAAAVSSALPATSMRVIPDLAGRDRIVVVTPTPVSPS